MSCPPGHLCLKHSNLILILFVTLVIFVVYVFQNPYGNHMVIKKQTNTIANAEMVPVEENEESELRKEKLRQEIVKIREENNSSMPSHSNYLRNKAYERVVNPLLPPERTHVSNYGVPINIPTRGPEGGYQQIGYIYKDEIDDENKTIGSGSDAVMLPLYGAPTYNGSNKWMYYISSDKFHSIKMPINHKDRKCDSEFGCDELYNNDVVDVPAYNGKFKVNIYEYDKPKYIPYVY
jgi:hypothetical protein